MKKKWYLFLIFVMSSTCTPSFGCRWCFGDRPKKALKSLFTLSDDQVTQLLIQSSAADNKDSDTSALSSAEHAVLAAMNQHDMIVYLNHRGYFNDSSRLLPPGGSYAPTQRGRLFYLYAIYTFFPKACLLSELYLPSMCPKAIDSAVREVAWLLADETWFFFTNQKEAFRQSAYWERIIMIAAELSIFLRSAQYNTQTGHILPAREQANHYSAEQKQSWEQHGMPVIDYLIKQGYTGFYDLYALYFDYALKIFNEGIKYEEQGKVKTFYYLLRRLVRDLTKSRHQALYQTAFERAKRLYSLFKKQQKNKEAHAPTGNV